MAVCPRVRSITVCLRPRGLRTGAQFVQEQAPVRGSPSPDAGGLENIGFAPVLRGVFLRCCFAAPSLVTGQSPDNDRISTGSSGQEVRINHPGTTVGLTEDLG